MLQDYREWLIVDGYSLRSTIESLLITHYASSRIPMDGVTFDIWKSIVEIDEYVNILRNFLPYLKLS